MKFNSLIKSLFLLPFLISLNACKATQKPLTISEVSPPVMKNGQLTFGTPELAISELQKAVNASSKPDLVKIFGGGIKPVLNSGDQVADAAGLKNVAQAMAERVDVGSFGELNQEKKVVMLIIGKESWPFPIALINEDGRWHFDTENGKEEILNRRIGKNELNVLNLCNDYVAAQREYAEMARKKVGALEYAQKFLSSPGSRDGLYWDSKPGEPQSPIGPFLAKAELEGYAPSKEGEGSVPYHGYFFRILKSQGTHAKGGARSYIENGKMTKGFAMLAYPAKWESSGVMSFLVGADGLTYEKDLGPESIKIASAIKQYDPDRSWRPAGK